MWPGWGHQRPRAPSSGPRRWRASCRSPVRGRCPVPGRSRRERRRREPTPGVSGAVSATTEAGSSAPTTAPRSVRTVRHRRRHSRADSSSAPSASTISATRSALMRRRPGRKTSYTVERAIRAPAGLAPSASRRRAIRAAMSAYDTSPDAMRRRWRSAAIASKGADARVDASSSSVIVSPDAPRHSDPDATTPNRRASIPPSYGDPREPPTRWSCPGVSGIGVWPGRTPSHPVDWCTSPSVRPRAKRGPRGSPVDAATMTDRRSSASAAEARMSGGTMRCLRQGVATVGAAATPSPCHLRARRRGPRG